MKKFLLIFLLLSRFVLADTPVSWQDLQKNIDSWTKGPVSLIMTDQEKDVWKKLKSPEEKMQFIKIFWARRDPILRTRENEFKEAFFDRVEYANKNYADNNQPGWQSARGQVYVLFGPPQREEKRILGESSRPALLWVYDHIPSNKIPSSEALLFIWRDFKYVLAPPNPDAGDAFGAAQREIDASLRYQTIPTAVAQAFVDVNTANVIDEKKDYRDLLSSVKSTERYGLPGIAFEMHVSDTHDVHVSIKPEDAPVYDDGEKVFAELRFQQQLRKGDVVVASNEHVATYSWDGKAFNELKEIAVDLPKLDAPAGDYDLWITVADRISQVSETRKSPVKW